MSSFRPLSPPLQPRAIIHNFVCGAEREREPEEGEERAEWGWAREGRLGEQSNMAAYLEDFLYWNMCKQFTHKGLK